MAKAQAEEEGGEGERGRRGGEGYLPVFFIYDSYHIAAGEWSQLLGAEGRAGSIRGTALDGVFIGLLLSHGDTEVLSRGEFDGAYTYFAAEGTSYGSTPTHWPALRQWACREGKLFVPSVGPGYNDERIRPWNSLSTKARAGGRYLDAMFRSAIEARADWVSVTSFNEWGEGTQIEPAAPRATNRGGTVAMGAAVADVPEEEPHVYLDYEEEGGEGFYLKRTAHWLGIWRRH